MSKCAECGRSLPPPARPGPPRVYCNPLCQRVAEHRITRTRRLCERLEEQLVAIRVEISIYGARDAPRGLERKRVALQQEYATAESRLHALLEQRSQDEEVSPS